MMYFVYSGTFTNGQPSNWNDSNSTFEPPHDKTNKMACAPSEDSDQPDPREESLGP